MSQLIGTNSMIITRTSGKTIWSTKVLIATVVMLASGTMNTISFKFQNKQNFKHGIYQTSLMFIGEYINLFLFALPLAFGNNLKNHFYELKEKADENISKPKPLTISKIRMGFASLFDSIGSSLQIGSLLLISASVNQMLSGGVIVTTCIFSKIFLGRHIRSHHYLGVGLCILGFICVGLSSIMATNSSDSNGVTMTGTIIGILMVLSSLVVQSTQYIYEEILMMNNQVPAQRMVGIEGMFGIIFIFFWVMIFGFIKCPQEDMCEIGGYLEDPVEATKQLFSDNVLMIWSLVTIISILLFNFYGLLLTQNVSSMLRAFMNASRTVFVWFFALVLGLESFSLKPFIVQMFGFVFLIAGNFIYNEIVELSFCGLNTHLLKYEIIENDGMDSQKLTNDPNDK